MRRNTKTMYELMDGFNEKPSRTTGRSRRDIFEAEEQPTLGSYVTASHWFRNGREEKCRRSGSINRSRSVKVMRRYL